jgi:mono/diheme cytochrome c family protein
MAVLPLCPPARLSAQAQPGKALYDRWCADCHGDAGAGDGAAAAWMLSRPRDFTKGVYQIRTTASGALPTDADIRRVIDVGMPGTTMPGWKSRFNERERDELVAYVKTFSRFFQGEAPTPLEFGKPPGGGENALAEGAEGYKALECFKCHGQSGRGDGTSAPTLQDDLGFPIRAADLTQPWTFNGGESVEAIYARLRTGLDGTPMPSFSDALEAEVVTGEQLWRVAQYVRSLGPERAPEVREVIRARRVATLPESPADTAWAAAEDFWIPLVGQIIQAPRGFSPSVTGLRVRAMHDGTRLALRITWDDRSRSPDTTWQQWLDRIGATVVRDDSAALVHGPDQLQVQFPVTIRQDAERPYFLGGSDRRPVHLWRWSSDAGSVQVGTGRGLGRFTPAAGPPDVQQAARFDQGEWQLQLTRNLVVGDTAGTPAFAAGSMVPIGFMAADGSQGEDLQRGAISAWYAVYLDVPTPTRVYIQPVIAAVLTAGLGVLVVARAQRRPRRFPEGEES